MPHKLSPKSVFTQVPLLFLLLVALGKELVPAKLGGQGFNVAEILLVAAQVQPKKEVKV